MRSRQVSISIGQIKFFGGVFLLLVLGVIGFVVFEGRPAAQASEMASATLAEVATSTAFVPSATHEAPLLASTLSTATNPTARPTVIYEDGDYPTAIPAAMPTMSNITPDSLPPGVNPLTGTYPDALHLLDRRPIASKITLYPRNVRPQYGLAQADVVYEYYIEWGLTRFIAVFYGTNPAQIGPVRSGRFFDEHIAQMYQAYLVFKYADKRVLDYFYTSEIRDFLVLPLTSNCSPFFVGTENRELYNNIFFDYTRFGPCLNENGFDNEPPHLQAGYFSQSPQFYGQTALHIFGNYSVDDYHYWQYDPLKKRYFRYQETDDTRDGKAPDYAPLIDKLTGEQVSADNVVYLFVPHSFADHWQREDQVYHIDPTGTGEAYLFRDGLVVPAYWQRFAVDQPLQLTTPNGEPLFLKPGRTFYEIMSEDSRVDTQGTDWFFEFEP